MAEVQVREKEKDMVRGDNGCYWVEVEVETQIEVGELARGGGGRNVSRRDSSLTRDSRSLSSASVGP